MKTPSKALQKAAVDIANAHPLKAADELVKLVGAKAPEITMEHQLQYWLYTRYGGTLGFCRDSIFEDHADAQALLGLLRSRPGWKLEREHHVVVVGKHLDFELQRASQIDAETGLPPVWLPTLPKEKGAA